jgi:hypothetical protein
MTLLLRNHLVSALVCQLDTMVVKHLLGDTDSVTSVLRVDFLDSRVVLTTVNGMSAATPIQIPSEETNLVVVLLMEWLVGTLLVVDPMMECVVSLTSLLETT